MKQPAQKLTGDQLIENARRLGPVLRDRAAATEQDRRVSDETYADIQSASLLHLFKPARYGGFELGLEEYVAVTMELARSCSATGWAYSLLCEHNLFVSLFPGEAQDDVWGEDSYASIAASIYVDPKRAHAARVPGGFRLSGQFGFASGSDLAQWLMFTALVDPETDADGAEPEVCFFLVPKAELTSIDDWFVLGMRGTGSHSWRADDVFVPAHRSVRRVDLTSGRFGAELHPTFDLIHYGRGPISTFVVSAPVAGIAQAAVERFAEIAKKSARRMNTGTLAESEIAQLMLAECAVEAFTARMLVETGARQQMDLVRAHQPIPEELQARLSRDSAYVGVLARRCVDRLHGALGSQAVFDGHPMHQAIRDVHTAVAQGSMNWERVGLRYARSALDLEPAPATVSRTTGSYIR